MSASENLILHQKGDGPESGLSKQRLRLWLRLLRATRAIENDLRERLRQEFQTTLPRFDVLAALDRVDDGLKMSELSRKLMVSNGNVTGIIERLVEDGLVERVAIQGDRRATRVRLTPGGKEVFAGMARQHESWLDDIMSGLNEEEIATLFGPLDALMREGEKDQ
ncbi:MarR family winged helix-turn-helix transcriptional regulator [Rhodovibrionaceae bacterium A322]